MSKLYDIFSLLNARDLKDGFVIHSIPGVINHKIGVSANQYPMFFIKCTSYDKIIQDKSLELILIQFNKECNLYEEDELIDRGCYTILTLRSDVSEIQKYFIDILFLLVKRMPAISDIDDIHKELNLIVELFRSFSKPPLKSILGIWAEMLIIGRALDTDYLVEAWHSSILSNFDFNDGFDKIEVKSTTRDKRIHRFSHSQLNTNISSKLIIASVMTSETGTGVTIFNLRDLIYDRLVNKNLIIKIDDIISKTLGRDIEKAIDLFFDYNLAIDSLKFYNSINIPSIRDCDIPNQITHIKFDLDLSDIEFMNQDNANSKMEKAMYFFM